LGDRKGIQPTEKLDNFYMEVLFRNKWRKTTERELANSHVFQMDLDAFPVTNQQCESNGGKKSENS